MNWLSSGTSLFKHFWMTYAIISPHPTWLISPHVIPVEILDERDHIHAQSVDQRSDLLRLPGLSQEVHHLLHRACPMHVQRDADQVGGDRFDDGGSLRIR